jgi:predicted permease
MDLRLESNVYEHAGCYIAVSGNVADPADAQTTGPEWLDGEMLSHGSAMAVGARPLMGRWFTQEEDSADAERVILISYDLWQRLFNGASDILGRRLSVADFGGNVDPSTIIGVMPPNFSFAGATSDYFVPLRPTNRLRNSPARNRWVVARLKPGITIEQAQEGANEFAANLERDSPRNKGWGITVEPVTESQVRFLRAPFQMLQGAAALVLLIACANVGGLRLAQGITRQHELAVRAAIGSGRWRIVRQLLTESVVLSVLGALLSIVAIGSGINALLKWLPAWIPRLNEVAIDDRVLLFTTVVSVLTSLVFGMLPALSASRLDLAAAFKASSRSASSSPGRLRLRSVFVVLQVSSALVLLTGAQEAAKQLDPAHAVIGVQLLEDFAEQQTQGFRQYVILLGVFSAIALVIAVVGVYGVMSHSVVQRTSEIGIRVAFGATSRNLLAIVLRQGLLVIGLGMAVGLAASLGATQIISSCLYGVTATDPVTFAIVLLVLFVVACLACYVPARRALKVDPLVAMLHD